MQVDTAGELEMKYNLHECYVHLKQFTDAIHTVRCLFIMWSLWLSVILSRLTGSAHPVCEPQQ